MPKPMIIAVDGPAASGKGTLSRRLAEHFGLRHLDTGLSYRAVAQALLLRGLPLDEELVAEDTARKVDLSSLSADTLSAHSVGEAASRVAVMPAVRRVLVEKQREFAHVAPGAVLDGRDIGTVVCPDAQVKLYVTAAPFVRAERRYREIVAGGGTASFARILADIHKRDARDTSRTDSPLKPAEDALLLDTSQMDIDTAFAKAQDLIEAAFAKAN